LRGDTYDSTPRENLTSSTDARWRSPAALPGERIRKHRRRSGRAQAGAGVEAQRKANGIERPLPTVRVLRGILQNPYGNRQALYCILICSGIKAPLDAAGDGWSMTRRDARGMKAENKESAQ